MAAPELALRPMNEAQTVYLDLALDQISGTPVVDTGATFYRNLSGEELADEYLGQFTGGSVTPGATGELNITTSSPRNPYGMVANRTHTVALDGTTIHERPVPGVGFALSNSGSFADTWQFRIRLGLWLPEVDQGNPLAGGAAYYTAVIAAKNTSAFDLSGCYAALKKPVKYAIVAGGGGLERVQGYTNDPIEIADPVTGIVQRYRVTYPLVVAGSPKRFDLNVAPKYGVAAAVNVRDLDDPDGLIFPSANGTTGAMIADGRGYAIESGGLTGVRIWPRTTLAGSDVANILPFNIRGSQITTRISGNYGVWGTTNIQLSGGSPPVAGVIRAGSAGLFGYRIRIASDFPPQGPYPFDITFLYRTTGTIGYLAA